MTIQPQKYMFIRLNDELEMKISIPTFLLVMSSMALITLFANIFALFSVPLYIAVIFAAVSDKIQYRSDDLFISEEE